MKSEKVVSEAVRVIEEKFINPFGIPIDKLRLYNISSGVPVDDNIALEILNLHNEGNKLKKRLSKEVDIR